MAYEITSHLETLTHDGLSVLTEIFAPAGVRAPDAGWPAVIISHGFSGSHAGGRPYAEAFAPEGFVVASFDFCGGGSASRSSGSMDQMSIMTGRQDLLCVFNHVRSMPNVDPARIVLMGMSQGGVISSMVGCLRPKDVRALVLFYPAYVLRHDALAMFPKPELVPMAYEHKNATLGRIYAVDAIAWDPFAHLGEYDGPVHIWHGDKDPIAPLPDSERAITIFPHAELTVVPGAGHGFGERRVEVIPGVLDFLKQVV